MGLPILERFVLCSSRAESMHAMERARDVLRVMIVRNEIPQALVEWLER